MRIGISINGVLRNYFKQIEVTHAKYFPPSEVEDEEGFRELSEPIKVLDYDLEKWVTFPKEELEQVELSFDPEFDPLSSKSRDRVEDLDLESVEEEVTLNEFFMHIPSIIKKVKNILVCVLDFCMLKKSILLQSNIYKIIILNFKKKEVKITKSRTLYLRFNGKVL